MGLVCVSVDGVTQFSKIYLWKAWLVAFSPLSSSEALLGTSCSGGSVPPPTALGQPPAPEALAQIPTVLQKLKINVCSTRLCTKHLWLELILFPSSNILLIKLSINFHYFLVRIDVRLSNLSLQVVSPALCEHGYNLTFFHCSAMSLVNFFSSRWQIRDLSWQLFCHVAARGILGLSGFSLMLPLAGSTPGWFAAFIPCGSAVWVFPNSVHGVLLFCLYPYL